MKKISAMLMLAAAMLFGASAQAQKVKSSLVPASVTTAFKTKYPKAYKVTWEKENGNFEANWGGKSGEDMSVVFTPSGSFVEQVEAISVSALPTAANAYIKAHYAGKKVSEAGKVTDAAGKITYEAEIKGMEVVFDQKGTFIKAGKEND
ncbi:PepSY-like domain-containing protein [Mucilaginibacter segetis]|uniref:PepSY-like domain-containing protein n=1 Tax=Mucilaginibacter segetis TaxID=2793071 RepID=A0A934PPT9_9SPHI|nr:PepSY-like domain-containing protein [Mucilaginibacter segetis]MBK0378513.1 PepSY-like domain-containing protein [Mucilaginibacter segetis]